MSRRILAALVEGLGDPRLRYHHLRNLDQQGVKQPPANWPLTQPRSDRLITLDSDDLNHPHRAAAAGAAGTESPRLIYTRVHLFSSSNPKGHAKPVLQPFSAPLLEMLNFITNPGTAFNRAAYQAAGGSPTTVVWPWRRTMTSTCEWPAQGCPSSVLTASM